MGSAFCIWLLMASPVRSVANQDLGPVYIAYAGPYSTSPSSAFGHLFLILQPNSEAPVPLWDVVSFSANTEGAGFLRYFFVGIKGGFLGSYKTNKFHEKVREYEVLEDRDLWLVRLRLSEQERAKLQELLISAEGQRYPYKFFSKNCAYYLQLLLSEVLPAMPQPAGHVSPVGVLELAMKLGLTDASFFRPSLSRRLAHDAHALSSPAAKKLNDDPWQHLAMDHDWLRSLNPADREIVQERFNFETLKLRQPLDAEVREGLALLRVLNASAPAQPGAIAASRAPGQPIPEPDFHSYGRLTTSSAYERGHESSISLRYRPALHEVNDPWLGYRPVNTLSSFAVAASGNPGLTHVRIQEFSLFSQRSLSPMGGPSANPTWLLDIGMKRGGIFDASSMHAGFRFGRGWTTSPTSGLYAYALGTGAAVGARRHAVTFAPGCQIGVLYLAHESWRWGAQWDWECDIAETSRDFGSFDAWFRRDIGAAWGITLHVQGDSDSDRARFRADIDWYP